MLRCPTSFCRGAAKILLSSVRTAETILPTTVYMKECSCSLTEKNALRKEGFPGVYKRFDALADFLGCSKKALAIRMKQLGLLKKEYLDNPFDLVTVYPEVSEL